MKLTDSYRGLPVWAWLGVGGAAAAGLFVFVRGYRQAAAGKTAASSGTASTALAQPPLIIPLPGPPGQSITGPQGSTGVPGPQGDPGTFRQVPLPVVTPAPVPASPAPATQPDRVYTIQPGDTLYGIAQRDYGSSARVGDLIGANLAALEQFARSHGQWNPADPGHWIYPGEQIVEPGIPSNLPIGTSLPALTAWLSGLFANKN